MRIYVKHSTQSANITTDGQSEMYHASIVARLVVDILSRVPGIVVRLMPEGLTSAQVRADIRAFNPDAIVDLHTNAGGGHGTVALCNEMGQDWATALYSAVAPLTPDADRGVKISTEFWFLNMGYKACILEMLFHDCAEEVAWYEQNYATLAQGVAQGIMNYCGVSGEVGNVRGIILAFGDADWDAAKAAHNATGFPITTEEAYAADPFTAGVRIHVGGPDLQNTSTDIYCAGINRMETLKDVLRELHIL